MRVPGLVLMSVLASSAWVATGLGDRLAQASSRPNQSEVGFGSSFMERTFQSYVALPMNSSQLAATGWVRANTSRCDPHLGWQWTQGERQTASKPIVLYTTRGGQISGVGVLVAGELPGPQTRWAQRRAGGWQIDVGFRAGPVVCSGEISPASIGDRLVVNPSGSEQLEIPVVETGAESAGWHRGSCFDGMGWHRYLDTQLMNGQMSWRAQNLFPVAAMYSDGQITAINFAAWSLQQGLTGTHQWDPLPTPSAGLCAGMCDESCKTFAGTHFWSTLHIYFREHSEIRCEAGLSCKLGKSGTGNGLLCCKAPPARLLAGRNASTRVRPEPDRPITVTVTEYARGDRTCQGKKKTLYTGEAGECSKFTVDGITAYWSFTMKTCDEDGSATVWSDAKCSSPLHWRYQWKASEYGRCIPDPTGGAALTTCSSLLD